jgi:hypothetical protein
MGHCSPPDDGSGVAGIARNPDLSPVEIIGKESKTANDVAEIVCHRHLLNGRPTSREYFGCHANTFPCIRSTTKDARKSDIPSGNRAGAARLAWAPTGPFFILNLRGAPHDTSPVLQQQRRRYLSCRRQRGRALVRIGNHPGTSQERGVEDGLTPLERDFGACRDDGYPHKE